MSINDSKGLILVYHSVIEGITFETIREYLPADIRSLDRKEATIRPLNSFFKLGDFETCDWNKFYQSQIQQFDEQLKPLLNQFPTYTVVYAGFAPIPLIIHLGYLVGPTRKISVFQPRHDTKNWDWAESESESKIVSARSFDHDMPGKGEVVFRCFTSHRINAAETDQLVPELFDSIELATVNVAEDTFTSEKSMVEFADRFKGVLDNIDTRLRNVDKVHLFASVPTGLAFLMGARISQTMHKEIVLYQYSSSSTPKHKVAFHLNGSDRLPRIFSPEEKKEILALSKELEKVLKADIEPFVNEKVEFCFKNTVPQSAVGFFSQKPWSQIPPIAKLSIPNAPIVVSPTQREFKNDPTTKQWIFGEELLWGIHEATVDSDDARLAGMLFFLHEYLHPYQKITSETAALVGQFPKILEDVDYIADVWSLIIAYGIQNGKAPVDPRQFFSRAVSVLIHSLIGFDKDGSVQKYFPQRRINRYLIWFWQLLSIENSSNETDVFGILSDKPVIELKGPKIETRDDRIVYSLNSNQFVLELAILRGIQLERHANSESTQIENLINGFRHLDFETLKTSLKSFYDKIE